MAITKRMRKIFNQEAKKRMEPTEVKKKKNILSQRESYQLTKFIEMNHVKFNQENLTMEQVALNASQSLGIEVTATNIRNAYSIVGINIPHKKTKRNKNAVIMRAVRHLYTKLGEPLPEEFVNLESHING